MCNRARASVEFTLRHTLVAAQVVKGALPAIRNAEGFDWDNESIYIWPSITQRSYQTAEILGSQLGVSRNRIVPGDQFCTSLAKRMLAPAHAHVCCMTAHPDHVPSDSAREKLLLCCQRVAVSTSGFAYRAEFSFLDPRGLGALEGYT